MNDVRFYPIHPSILVVTRRRDDVGEAIVIDRERARAMLSTTARVDGPTRDARARATRRTHRRACHHRRRDARDATTIGRAGRDSRSGPTTTPLVKVCGIVSVEDARAAIENGANFIGMILWPKSKRSVSRDVARDVAKYCVENGATPVAVFVDETAEEITEICDAIGCDHAQLHGDGAREALETLPTRVRAIWTLAADADGKIVTSLPGDEEKLIAERQKRMGGAQGWKAAIDFVSGPRRVVDWVLIDGVAAGSGTTFDWRGLKVPRGCSRKGWLLAGGLNPENVAEAVETVRPDGVDVATGVADESGVKKDPAKIAAFIANARAATPAKK